MLRVTALPLPDSAAHVSRVLGEETVLLRWFGATEAQLSSMLDAPAGAHRVILTENMRFAVGRRAAEVRLVTADDLDAVTRAAANRRRG